MLTKMATRLKTAKDGVVAINALQKRTFDLVLLDIKLPRVDGVRGIEIHP